MPKDAKQPPPRAGRVVVLLTVALSLTSLALGAWMLATVDRTASDQFASDVDVGTLDTIDVDAVATLDAERPVYRYSVIPGGVYSASDLRHAIRVDPIVAAHYHELDQSKLQVRTVTHDQYAYVSYRKGDEIFWTTTKVVLRKGEAIITDGTTQIRARCGNCISLEPQLPTTAEEPEVVEFDRLVDPDPASVPAEETEVALAPPASPVAAAAPDGAQPVDPAADPLAAGRFFGRSSLPLAAEAPGSGNDPDLPGPADVPGPATPLPPLMPQPPVFVPPTQPGHPLPPLVDDPPGDQPPPWVPPTGPPPGKPDEPVPVPEPGTLLLVGGGIAALVRRHLRAGAR